MIKKVIPFTFILLISCAGLIDQMQSTDYKKVSDTPFLKKIERSEPIAADSIQVLALSGDSSGDFMSPLKRAMNRYLADSLRLAPDFETEISGQGMPEVDFGRRSLFTPDAEKDGAGDMVFKVVQPSRSWKKQWHAAHDKPYSLVLKAGVSGYSVRVRNLLLSKEIRLGTDYTESLPWLTSSDQPLMVVHVVGYVMNEYGRVIKTGAEGFYLKPGDVFDFFAGTSSLLTKEDMRTILESHRRHADEKLAWQTALDLLIRRLMSA